MRDQTYEVMNGIELVSQCVFNPLTPEIVLFYQKRKKNDKIDGISKL